MQILSEIDLVMFPIYFALVTMIVLFYNYYKVSDKYRVNFIISYFIKVLCTIAYAFLFNSYYQSGDTINYYNDAVQFKSFILQDFNNLNLLWSPVEYFWNICQNCILSYSDSSYLIAKSAGLLLIITFGSYLSTALIFGLLSHLGTYKIVETFSFLFPKTNFKILFFIPSVLFWSSGIMKDGLCIFSLGYLFSILEKSLKRKTLGLLNIIAIIIFCYILLILKGYILISFLFCYAVRVYLFFKDRIENKILATLAGFAIGSSIIMLVIGISSFSDKFVFENLLETSVFTQKAIYDLQGGSTYEIVYDITPLGILSALIQSFVVSFFRPFLWESFNPLILLFALESIFMGGTLIYTFFFRFKTKIPERHPIHPIVIFSLLFSLIFGITVGFTSSNFGALMRYKIPYLLFYIAALIILYDQSKKK